MESSYAVAAFEHPKWLTHDANYLDPNGKPIQCQSRAAIDFPAGDYWLTSAIAFGQGRYTGLGPNDFYTKQGPTAFQIWHEKWRGDAIRRGVQTITTGNDTIYGYLEAARIVGFRVNARREQCPSGVKCYGANFWDMGSSSFIDQIFVRGAINSGFEFVRGTPVSVGTISSFDHGEGAVAWTGSDLSTMNIAVLECDDTAAAFMIRDGYGRPGGGVLNVGLLKMECGKRPPLAGQIVMDAKGAICANFGAIQMDHQQERVDAAFVIDSGTFMAMVNVGVMRGWGYDMILQHIGKKEAWSSPGDYRPISFTWDSDNGITRSNRALTKVVHNATERLGIQTWNGSAYVPPFDRIAGTPKYTPRLGGTTPPPNPVACTGWTAGAWSAWSTCVNGTQTRTRTVTATPAGCTGTPPNKPVETETQACTAPPPGSVKYSAGPFANIQTASCVTLTPAITATQVRLTAFKTSSLQYGRIVGTGAGQQSLVVFPDGTFRWGSSNTSWTICATSPNTKVALNTAWSGAITLPAAKAITCPWHTDCASGGAPPGSCTLLELL